MNYIRYDVKKQTLSVCFDFSKKPMSYRRRRVSIRPARKVCQRMSYRRRRVSIRWQAFARVNFLTMKQITIDFFPMVEMTLLFVSPKSKIDAKQTKQGLIYP